MSDGGKGSAPRKQQDHGAYSKNWDAIFGKKLSENLLQNLVNENERIGLYDPCITDNFKNPMIREQD